MIGGGELGGDRVQTRETWTEPLGGKGSSRGFEERAKGLDEKEVSLSVATTIG
jgi:hypothetical protein